MEERKGRQVGIPEGEREYKELCEQKKKEENEKWEKEVKRVKWESQVWGIVNRERRKWKGIKEDIKIEE